MLLCRPARSCARVSAAGRTAARIAAAAAVLFAVTLVAGCASLLPRQYEYEEEIYLALDGTATVYVNSSVPALVALRGLSLDLEPRTTVDRAAVRRAYESSDTTVTRVSTSRRSGRRFVHVRLEVRDIRTLSQVAPFAWSSYTLDRRNTEYVYKQVVGAAAGKSPGSPGWKGDELVAFRMHLPSKIRYHDAPSKQVERGNILSWEQPLTDRLAGKPLSIEVRLDTQSILYRTLWLFALMIGLVACLFVTIIWWVVRTGHRREAAAPPRAPRA